MVSVIGCPTVDIYIYIYISCITLRTLNYGNIGIFLVMGNAGFISSTVGLSFVKSCGHLCASAQLAALVACVYVAWCKLRLNSKPQSLKPSNSQTFNLQPQTLEPKPSNPQTPKPQTLKPSNPKCLKPSNPQIPNASNPQTSNPKCLEAFFRVPLRLSEAWRSHLPGATAGGLRGEGGLSQGARGISVFWRAFMRRMGSEF